MSALPTYIITKLLEISQFANYFHSDFLVDPIVANRLCKIVRLLEKFDCFAVWSNERMLKNLLKRSILPDNCITQKITGLRLSKTQPNV